MEAPTADPMVHAEKEAERAENELVEVDTPDVVQEAISKNTETAEVSVNSTITTNEEVTERMQVDAAVVSVEGSERPLEPSMGSGKEPLGTLGEAVEDGVEKNDVEDPEGDAEVEGEGEEDGEEGSGSEDEDEEEDEEEEEDESDGDESEDLEGSHEIIAIDGPDGSPHFTLHPVVKTEPTSPGSMPTTLPTEPIETLPTTDGAENVLVPKKKKRARLRSPSEDEDLAPPPPPMKTIRLERPLVQNGETMEWNILDDARANGLCVAWGVGVVDDLPGSVPGTMTPGAAGMSGLTEEGMEIDGSPVAGSSTGGVLGIGFADEDPEEIARKLEEKYGDKKKTKKKKRPTDYDLEDPFIDDSEIMIDAPTHYARPAREGFFVHSGPLQLMKESPLKKRNVSNKPKSNQAKSKGAPSSPEPKAPRTSLAASLLARIRAREGLRDPSSHEDIQDGPISVTPNLDTAGGNDGDDNNDVLWQSLFQRDLEKQPPVDRVMFRTASRHDKYLPPYPAVPQEVARALLALRLESLEYDWDHANRSKFPEHLKPSLKRASTIAYQHDVFDVFDHTSEDKGFAICLQSVYPYNVFTLRKLVTKLIYEGYLKWLQDCEDEGIRQFKEEIDKDSAMWIEKYETSKRDWEVEVAAWDEKHPFGSHISPPLIDVTDPSSSAQPAPKPEDIRPPEPQRRFVWTSEMRDIFWQLIENLRVTTELIKKGADWHAAGAKNGKEWTEQGLKSRLYKKIVDIFPEGYTNNNIISRELTKLKKRKEEAQKKSDDTKKPGVSKEEEPEGVKSENASKD